MDRTVDLRSDTITRPTEAMWEAMHHADVGDDVYGEDPTVQRLQELGAELMGKEAGLFLPSGTMANTAALLAHTRYGDEMVVEELAHLYCWEAGAYSNIAGLATRPVRGDQGIFTAEQFEAVLRPPNPHFPKTSLLCLENTHNNAAGAVWSPGETAEVALAARDHGLRIHLDGARLFNAAVALGVDAKELAAHVDSVTFCVSKGLSAPVGSVLCGSRAFIEDAYRARKRLGGAMRQAGIMAAAGIVALETMVDRLAEDHETARSLAEGLDAIEGVTAVRAPRPTNILMVDVGGLGWSTADLIDRWLARGIKCNPRPPHARAPRDQPPRRPRRRGLRARDDARPAAHRGRRRPVTARAALLAAALAAGCAGPSETASPSNRLAAETSPYLLLHGGNPVDWYPWGPEALALARSEDRPIFLSVGYSTCYWCHVMEREVFSDPEDRGRDERGASSTSRSTARSAPTWTPST